ncbi:HLH domain-containing protein [Cephalotus follicularis]|uniref:HLH domain-containing protein n=1 Tax=Cephalotus follicularis TaxID=3775 RepID=A0A1Q3BWB4_CEPFO|nr:HLH domain-containing protein [Cephalotus follicularis]
MENCKSSWTGGDNWDHCNAAIGNESSFKVPWPHVTSSTTFHYCGVPSWTIPVEGFVEDRAEIVSKSHSQAEKRRRDRINEHLATLRKLIPKSDKYVQMHKAALLGSVIEHVKDLKSKVIEVSKSNTIPSEFDEVTVDCDHAQEVNLKNTDNSKDSTFIKASFCCDDRPELFSELILVLKGLGLTTVGADVVSISGRIKSILVLCNNRSHEEGVSLSTVKQSINGVLNRIASSSSSASNYHIRSKRQRFFLPSEY